MMRAKRIAYCAWGAFFTLLLVYSMAYGHPDLLAAWWARSFFTLGLVFGWYVRIFASDKIASQCPFPLPMF